MLEDIRVREGTLTMADAEEFEIEIGVEPFDSGLDYVPQPENTSFRLEGIYLPFDSVDALDGLDTGIDPDDSDGSIYLGSAHNPVDIQRLALKRRGDGAFDAELTLFCDLAYEGVAEEAETVTVATVLRVA